MSQNEINTIRAELDTQIVFADALARELAAIYNKPGDTLSKKDEKRVREIEELLDSKDKWIKKARARIAAYYRPATLAV